MKILIIIILALSAATAIGLVSLDDPGLMILSYGQDTWELPLVLALLLIVAAFAILYLLFNFIFGIFRAPKVAKKWNIQRQNKNAQTDTLRGYARLIEGDWAQGEKSLTKRLGYCKTPMLNYLGAAYAAQQQQRYEKRDQYLAEAEKMDPANKMAVDITRARLLTQAGDFQKAKTLLNKMHHHAPANKTILRLMADIFKQTEDWVSVKELLPKLNRTKALSEPQLISLDMAARAANLNDAVSDENNPSTMAQYKTLPLKRKKDANMAALYAKKLISEGALSEAEGVIRKAINHKWSSELVELYGKARIENLRDQITVALGWVAKHEDDANVYLTLARLNKAHNQMDKARVYYNQAIEMGAGDEAYYELAQFYEQEGNARTAMSYYKKGMQANINAETDAGLALEKPTLSEQESVVLPGSNTPSLVLVENAKSKDQKTKNVEEAVVIEHKA